MIICPMCEHQQAQGIECEVCGKKLAAAPPLVVQVAPVADLDTGRSAPVGAVAVAPVTDLDTGRSAPVGAVAVAPVTDMDTGRSAPVGNIVVSKVTDRDAGRDPDDGVRTAAPTGPAICRYCRVAQETGLVCDRCGMRLTRMRTPPPVTASAGLVPSGEWTKCSKCHTNTRAGRACVSCGTHIPSSD